MCAGRASIKVPFDVPLYTRRNNIVHFNHPLHLIARTCKLMYIWINLVVTCPEFKTKNLPSATKSIYVCIFSSVVPMDSYDAQFFLLVIVMRLVTPWDATFCHEVHWLMTDHSIRLNSDQFFPDNNLCSLASSSSLLMQFSWPSENWTLAYIEQPFVSIFRTRFGAAKIFLRSTTP